MLESMRTLVVEDDKKIASFVVNGLKQSGYAVDHYADGEHDGEKRDRVGGVADRLECDECSNQADRHRERGY